MSRVYYVKSEKVSTPNYGSKGIEVGMDTVVTDKETPDEALDRIKGLVDKRVEREIHEIEEEIAKYHKRRDK